MSEEKDTGGYVYPHVDEHFETNGGTTHFKNEEGITRRNKLIDDLVVGFMSADTILSGLDSETNTFPIAERIAFIIKNSIGIADIIIAESNK